MADALHVAVQDLVSGASSGEAVLPSIEHAPPADNGGPNAQHALWTEEHSENYHEHPDGEYYECHDSERDAPEHEEVHAENVSQDPEGEYNPVGVCENCLQQYPYTEDEYSPEHQDDSPGEWGEGCEEYHECDEDEYPEESEDWDDGETW